MKAIIAFIFILLLVSCWDDTISLNCLPDRFRCDGSIIEKCIAGEKWVEYHDCGATAKCGLIMEASKTYAWCEDI